MTAEVWTGTD